MTLPVIANCGICRKRPKDLGGSGSCPYRNSLYSRFVVMEVHDCPAFIKGDYLRKKDKQALRRGEIPEQEQMEL